MTPQTVAHIIAGGVALAAFLAGVGVASELARALDLRRAKAIAVAAGCGCAAAITYMMAVSMP